MRKYITLLMIMLAFPIYSLAGDRVVVEIVETYFAAVKAGDVATIHNLTGAPLSEQIGTLITNNAAYPEFLRAHYEGASAVVGNVSPLKKGDKQVDLIITYADQRQSLIELTLSRQKAGKWMVTNQREVIE